MHKTLVAWTESYVSSIGMSLLVWWHALLIKGVDGTQGMIQFKGHCSKKPSKCHYAIVTIVTIVTSSMHQCAKVLERQTTVSVA